MDKVYVVYGTYNDYEGDDWIYAICATLEIAKRELSEAAKETNVIDGEPEFIWDIHEWPVINE